LKRNEENGNSKFIILEGKKKQMGRMHPGGGKKKPVAESGAHTKELG